MRWNAWRRGFQAVLVAWLWPVGAALAAVPIVQLDGWHLLQSWRALEATLGPPFDIRQVDTLSCRAYRVDAPSYLVVCATQRVPHHVATLQLTGTSSSAVPFDGLALGDDQAKVFAALGASSSIERIEHWKVTRHDYEARNVSVELDDRGALYSIRIDADATVLGAADATHDPWPEFVAAMQAGDRARIAATLRPDVEIFRDGQVLSLPGRLRDFIEAPDVAFLAALTDAGQVAVASTGESTPATALRLTEHLGAGLVYTFVAGAPLAEVVFMPYAGRYRLYEIAFRDDPARRPRRLLGAARR